MQKYSWGNACKIRRNKNMNILYKEIVCHGCPDEIILQKKKCVHTVHIE